MVKKKTMKKIWMFAFWLTIVGAINWGLVGAFDFNFVAWIFGRFVEWAYIVVGLSGLFLLFNIFKK